MILISMGCLHNSDDLGRPGSSASGENSNFLPGVPTPPPRARISKNQRPYIERRSFTSLHEEFGLKIIRDQRARWHGEQSVSSKSKDNTGMPPSLSAMQQSMNF